MPRAFLSHSSKDKPIVGRVFKELTAASSHYDEKTFEDGVGILENILRALTKSDVFVLFVSQHSIASDWVQKEIAAAEPLFKNYGIKHVLVYILDDAAVDKLPAWLTAQVYSKQSNPKLIANKIRSTLLDIGLSSGEIPDFFLGRDDEAKELKSALTLPAEASPRAIFASGADGIGRRTLVKRSLTDAFPWIPKICPEVILPDYSDIDDFYRRIIPEIEDLTILEFDDKLKEFSTKSPEEKASTIAQALADLCAKKSFIYVAANGAFLSEDGYLQPWLASIVARLKAPNYPPIALISRRALPAAHRFAVDGLLNKRLQSISREDSKKLLSQWLKWYEQNFTSEQLNSLVPYVEGHPKSIQLAAQYIKEYKLDEFLRNPIDFRAIFSERAFALIQHAKPNDADIRLLALFRDYEFLSLDDVLSVVTGIVADELVQKSLMKLEDFGLIERHSSYYRIAPYLIAYIERYPWPPEVAEFRKLCNKRFLDISVEYVTEDRLQISTIDATVLASLRDQSGAKSPEWLKRFIYPSHLLRVAKELYDARHHDAALALCKKILEGNWALSPEATVEANRLLGITAIRLHEDDDFKTSLAGLRGINLQSARRNEHYLLGFNARYWGRIDDAERHYRDALREDGERNISILRELATVCDAQGQLDEAERFARKALEIAPSNQYVIDEMLNILQSKSLNGATVDQEEIRHLLLRLEETNSESKSFYESNMARYYAGTREWAQALKFADAAVRKASQLFNSYSVRISIRLHSPGHLSPDDRKAIEADLGEMERIVNDKKTGEGKRNAFKLDKARIEYQLKLDDLHEAVRLLDASLRMPVGLRNALEKRIVGEVARRAHVDPQLSDWARKRA